MSAGSLRGEGRGSLSRFEISRGRAWATPAVACLGLLVVLGAALRFYGLGRQGLWFDEADTALLMHYSPGEIAGYIPHTESTPYLYYVVVWLWSRVSGLGEAGLRSLSALCGVLVIPIAYALGRLLSTRRVGLVAAALVACNPFLIWYSQEARAYEMLVLLSALSLLGAAWFHTRPNRRALVLWAAASVLALLTHYYSVLVVVPTAAWLLIVHRRRREVWLAVGLVAACGAALLPLALTQNSTKHDAWISHSPLYVRLRQIIPQFVIGTGIPHRPIIKYVGYAAGLAGVLLLALRARLRERSAGLALAGVTAAGMLIVLLLMLAGFDDLITRNIIALFVPALIALACGFGARRAGILGLAAAAVLCLLGVYATVSIAADRDLQRPDWRPVARALGPGPRAGQPGRAILIQRYKYLLPLSLYLHHLHRFPVGGASVGELDVISFSAPKQPMCYWGAACNLIPSRMQHAYRVAGFHVLSSRRVRQFTVLRLVADHPVALYSFTVSAALRKTYIYHDDLLLQR